MYRKYMRFKVIIYALKIGDEYNWYVYDIIGINPYKQKNSFSRDSSTTNSKAYV